MEIIHQSVMADEAIRYLRPHRPNSLLIDCTLGEGGHTERFLQTFADLSVCGLDIDAAILAKAKRRLAPFGQRVCFFHSWYDQFLEAYPVDRLADQILFDLGISRFHYTDSGRGFSFQKDELLDMRLDVTAGESAADLVANKTEPELAEIFFRLGEERYARRIAKAVVEQRAVSPIATAKSLADLIWKAVPADYRYGRIHPATRSFQALRMAVNQELDRIGRALPAAFRRLSIGGLLGVITFHSLEDRLVKLFFKDIAKTCRCPPEQDRCSCDRLPFGRIVTKKPVVPGAVELRRNAPSRSAKFRVIQKLKG